MYKYAVETPTGSPFSGFGDSLTSLRPSRDIVPVPLPNEASAGEFKVPRRWKLLVLVQLSTTVSHSKSSREGRGMDKVPTVGTEAGVLYCPSLDPNKLSWMGDSITVLGRQASRA